MKVTSPSGKRVVENGLLRKILGPKEEDLRA
jgi:hypothetical protein